MDALTYTDHPVRKYSGKGSNVKARYVLIGISLVLAIFIFVTSPPLSNNVTNHVIYSLTYGFAAAFFGLIVAAIQYGFRRLIGKPQSYAGDWHWAWGIILMLVIASALWGVLSIVIVQFAQIEVPHGEERGLVRHSVQISEGYGSTAVRTASCIGSGWV